MNAIDNFEINVLPFSVPMIEHVACLTDSSTNADYISPQKDKVDREGRKSLKVVVPTQADSDENGIDLDDHVMHHFSQIFGIEEKHICPVSFLVSITQQLDAEPIDFPSSHGSQPYLHTSFYLQGKDLPTLMHIIGWRVSKSRSSTRLRLKKKLD